MISLQEFINNTQGQSLLYPPNPESLRGQCYQLINFYVSQVWGTPVIWREYAYQILDGAAATGAYSVTINNPNDPNQLPPVGAVLVWNSALPGSGGAGHTAVFISDNGNHTFTSYDTNWGGKQAHYVSHNWSYLAGWITPKQAVVVAPVAQTNNQGNQEEMISSDDQAIKMYKLLRPNGTPSDGEIQSTTNKRSYAQFVNDGQNEVNQRDQNLRDLAQHSADQQNLINQQNETIANLTASGTKSKDDYDAAVSKIADLNAQLATKHDLISDIQAKLSAAVTPAERPENDGDGAYGGTEQVSDTPKEKAPSWAVRVLMWVLSRRTKKA